MLRNSSNVFLPPHFPYILTLEMDIHNKPAGLYVTSFLFIVLPKNKQTEKQYYICFKKAEVLSLFWVLGCSTLQDNKLFVGLKTGLWTKINNLISKFVHCKEYFFCTLLGSVRFYGFIYTSSSIHYVFVFESFDGILSREKLVYKLLLP